MNIRVNNNIHPNAKKNLIQNQCYYTVDSEESTHIMYVFTSNSIAVVEGKNAVELSASVLKELHDLYEDLTWRAGAKLELVGNAQYCELPGGEANE